jgi:hypothetical protein
MVAEHIDGFSSSFALSALSFLPTFFAIVRESPDTLVLSRPEDAGFSDFFCIFSR